jgi:hypothetical protein
MGGACSTNGEKRKAYRLLVGKPEGTRPLGTPRRRWVDLVEVGWGGVDWIGLAQDMLGKYRVSKQLGISRVVLSSVELVFMSTVIVH